MSTTESTYLEAISSALREVIHQGAELAGGGVRDCFSRSTASGQHADQREEQDDRRVSGPSRSGVRLPRSGREWMLERFCEIVAALVHDFALRFPAPRASASMRADFATAGEPERQDASPPMGAPDPRPAARSQRGRRLCPGPAV